MMKRPREFATWLYIINLSLLAVHEIDSAYWHEWEIFRLPGGIQCFLVLNLLLLIPLTYGLVRVVRWQPGAKVFSYLVAGAGIFAFLIHATFLAVGRDEFRLPVSLALLVGTLLASTMQIIMVAHCGKPEAKRAAPE